MFSKCCHDPVYYANRDCATLDTSRINIVRASISSILFSRPRVPVVSRLVHVLFLYLPSHSPQRIFPILSHWKVFESPFTHSSNSFIQLFINSFFHSLFNLFLFISCTDDIGLSFGFLFISLQSLWSITKFICPFLAAIHFRRFIRFIINLLLLSCHHLGWFFSPFFLVSAYRSLSKARKEESRSLKETIKWERKERTKRENERK